MAFNGIPADDVASIADIKSPREVLSHDHLWSGRVIGLEVDRVRVVDGTEPVQREYTSHPGAVAVVVIRGEAGAEEILLERQYRHPVRAELWEVPAGLLDIEDEDPLTAAKRELREEVDMTAERWDVLMDYFTSPGGSSESIRIFLARELHDLDEEFEREDEEATMVVAWVSLDDAVSMVLGGKIHNPNATHGILAAYAARSRGWEALRAPADSWFR